MNKQVELVSEFKNEFNVMLCCSVLGLARSTYYASQKKISLTEKYRYLKDDIEEIIENNSGYGYRRINDALRNEYNQLINHKPLQKLLKEWNLSLKRKIKKRRPSGIESALKEMGVQANILKTLDEDEIEVFKVWHTDFTTIYTDFGKVYLMPYLDHKSKIVAGYSMSLNPNTEMAKRAYAKLKIFLKEHDVKTAGLILHQDQGKPYTSYEYVSTLVSDDIIPSYSRVATPGDNAEAESFFGRLKDDWREVFAAAKNYEELEALVEHAIKYYNHNRIHSKTNGKSPINNLPTILSN